MSEHVKRLVTALCVAFSVASCARAPKPRAPQPAPPNASAVAANRETAGVRQPSPVNPLARLVPLPQRVEPASGEPFTFTPQTAIVPSENTPLVLNVAAQLVTFVRRATGVTPPILVAHEPVAPASVIGL